MNSLLGFLEFGWFLLGFLCGENNNEDKCNSPNILCDKIYQALSRKNLDIEKGIL